MSRDFTCDCDVIHADTVNSVREKLLSDQMYEHLSTLYKMLADNTRLRVLWALAQSEMCVCDIAVLLGMTKSAISHHLKALRLTNLVKSRKEGKIVFYSLTDDHVVQILNTGVQHMEMEQQKHTKQGVG